jgi:hypothetical protein
LGITSAPSIIVFHGLSGGNTSQVATVTPGPASPPGTPPTPPSVTVLPELLPDAPLLLPLLPPDEPPEEELPDDPPDEPPEDPELPPLEPPVALSPEPPSAALDELLLLHPLEKARATAVPTVSGQTSQDPLAVLAMLDVGGGVNMDRCSPYARRWSNHPCSRRAGTQALTVDAEP